MCPSRTVTTPLALIEPLETLNIIKKAQKQQKTRIFSRKTHSVNRRHILLLLLQSHSPRLLFAALDRMNKNILHVLNICRKLAKSSAKKNSTKLRAGDSTTDIHASVGRL